MFGILGMTALLVAVQTSPDAATEACRVRLSQKAHADIGELTVTSSTARGRRHVTLRGTFNQLEPAQGRPGELTPHHIVSTRKSFTCTLSRGSVRSVSIR